VATFAELLEAIGRCRTSPNRVVGISGFGGSGKSALARRHEPIPDADERVWDDVWMPNERDFAARFRPREAVDLHYVPST